MAGQVRDEAARGTLLKFGTVAPGQDLTAPVNAGRQAVKMVSHRRIDVVAAAAQLSSGRGGDDDIRIPPRWVVATRVSSSPLRKGGP